MTLGYGFDITGVWLHTIHKIGDRVVMYKDRNIGWARVIAHVDADAFFASCEQLRNPYLRNKPVCVVSGKRGMVIAKSYEAKYKGVKTGMPSWEAKKLIRDGEFIICDHAYYGKISKQIFTVLKRWTEEMEIYSVDECFLDLTTLDNGLKMSFEDIGKKMQREVLSDVGINVSIGISGSKILAKLGSNSCKPFGVMVIDKDGLNDFLLKKEVGEVCGIGRRLELKLVKQGIGTVFDFVSLSLFNVHKMLGKVGVDLWRELQGQYIYKINKYSDLPKSIMRTSSFENVSGEKMFVYSNLMKHLQEAYMRMFLLGLVVKEIGLYVKYDNFVTEVFRIQFHNHVDNFIYINKSIDKLFQLKFRKGYRYRSIGVVFSDLLPKENKQYSLFDDIREEKKVYKLEEMKQKINLKYGRFVIRTGNSLFN